jgi:hypothetical protein
MKRKERVRVSHSMDALMTTAVARVVVAVRHNNFAGRTDISAEIRLMNAACLDCESMLWWVDNVARSRRLLAVTKSICTQALQPCYGIHALSE